MRVFQEKRKIFLNDADRNDFIDHLSALAEKVCEKYDVSERNFGLVTEET